MAQVTYSEPTWGDPQLTYCEPSYLHALGVTPFIMLGILTQLIRYQFSTVDNIINPYLQNLIWTADRETTKVTVVPGQDVDLDTVSPGPRVHILLDPVRSNRMGALTGDSMPVGANQFGYVGRRDYQRLLMSGARIVCVSSSEVESQLMGEEVFNRMMVYAHKIREDIGVGMFKVDSLYPPRAKERPEKGIKVFFSTVQVNWDSMYRWSLVAEAPTVKRLYQRQHTIVI